MTNSIFENIKHIDNEGNEYWYARELMKVLEYSEYRKFKPIISKAMNSCENSKQDIEYHFAHVDDMIIIGKAVRKTIKTLGGTMPEDQPTPKKSIKQIEKGNNNEINKDN